MKLYNRSGSGNSYKVRLFVALAGIPGVEQVDLKREDQKQEWFTKLNPWQLIPVIDDAGTVVWDAQAILVYLAEKYEKHSWLPTDPLGRAKVTQWLSIATNELLHGCAYARAVKIHGYPFDYEAAAKTAARLLGVLEGQLTAQKWLAAETPTIADCAIYSYVKVAPQGDISLEPYPAVRRWLRDIEALPGYVSIESN